MEVFFGLNKIVGKSQGVQAGNKPRRDLNAFEWLFVTHCRALPWERLPAPATALRWQRQMQTCDKSKGQESSVWEMTTSVTDGSATSRAQCLEGITGLSQKELRRVEGSCESPRAQQHKQCHIHPPPTPPHVQHTQLSSSSWAWQASRQLQRFQASNP